MRLLNDAISLHRKLLNTQGTEHITKDIPPDFNEHGLKTVVPAPVSQDREFRGVDFAIHLANKGKVHARDELNCRRGIGVLLSTSDLQAIDAVLMDGLTIRMKGCLIRNGPIDCPQGGIFEHVHVLDQLWCRSSGSS